MATITGSKKESGPRLRTLAGLIVGFGKAIWNGRPDAAEESVLSTGDEPPLLDYGNIDRGYTALTRWLSYLAALALGVVTLVCFIDVISWKFFGWPFPSAISLIAHLNLVLVFLAAAYVQMDRGSVAIELFQSKFNSVVKLSVRIFASILGAASCLFATYRGWYFMADQYHTNAMAEGVWHFRLWPFQASLVLGFFCLGVAFLFTIGRDVTNFRKRRDRYADRATGSTLPGSE